MGRRSRDEMEAIAMEVVERWVELPSLRLGQLLVNAATRRADEEATAKRLVDADTAQAIFYIEDEVLIEALEDMVEPIRSEQRSLL